MNFEWGDSVGLVILIGRQYHSNLRLGKRVFLPMDFLGGIHYEKNL